MENTEKQIKPVSVRSDGVSEETRPTDATTDEKALHRAKMREKTNRNLRKIKAGTPEARELSRLGNLSKKKLAEMRAAIRAEILRQCTPELLAKRTVDAIKQGNLELATVLEKCSKMVGTHFEQTEEYVQHFDSKSKTEGTTSVKLVIEDMAKPVEG